MNVRASVCMATYNGAQYLRQQLDSIFPQLSAEDELIVSDDNSTDCTREILASYGIVPLLNSGTRGHVHNFANAMEHAKGQLIALSDQDDIWPEGRLERMVARMRETRCDLLIGDFQEFGGSCQLPPLGRRPFFILPRLFLGNLKYFGCTFLMTRELARSVLPIPPYIEAHDVWIAMNAAAFASIAHLEEVVTLRRIHPGNLTSRRRHLGKIAKSRACYAFGLATALPGDYR